MNKAGIADPADVHFVQVKGPAFTLADIVAAERLGASPASDNPGKLMGFGSAASAFGVGNALGEISPERATEAAVLNDFGGIPRSPVVRPASRSRAMRSSWSA